MEKKKKKKKEITERWTNTLRLPTDKFFSSQNVGNENEDFR